MYLIPEEWKIEEKIYKKFCFFLNSEERKKNPILYRTHIEYLIKYEENLQHKEKNIRRNSKYLSMKISSISGYFVSLFWL